jgi:4-amino-4-deoxy-L-arabinose transferase-like glycosyltransferase
MWERGEWVVLRVNGDPYPDKPILFFWLALISSKILGGVSELSVRLPSSLAAGGLVLVTYWLVREFFGKERAFLSGLVLATSLRVMWEARWAHTDMLLALLITLTMLFFLRAFYAKGTPKQYYLVYAMMGLATLTKGLIGFVLPGLVILSFLAFTGSLSRLREVRIPTGAIVFLLIVSPWFIAIVREVGSGYLVDFIWIQHFQRYLDPRGHREPFYYYLLNLPADLLPWTLYVPGAVATWIKRKKEALEGPRLFFLLWIAVILIFFNFTSQKRSLYLLPIFPPLAAMIAGYLQTLLHSPKPLLARFTRSASIGFFAVLVLLSILGLPVMKRMELNHLASILPFSFFLLLASAITIYLLSCRLWLAVYLATALTMAGTMIMLYGWIFPLVNPLVSPKLIGKAIHRIVPPDDPLWIYKDTMNDINFYAARERIPVLREVGELEEKIKARGKGYMLIRERDHRKLNDSLPYRTQVLAEGAQRGKKWKLLSITYR